MKTPNNLYILMSLDRAFRIWQQSGKRCKFGNYCLVLRSLGYRLIMSLCMVGAAAGMAGTAWASGSGQVQPIDKVQAVSCIIGEAENQGPLGMAAIAHALRNRGTVKGCYGVNSKRVRNRLYSSKTLVQAIKAWEESAKGFDLTQGATGWGNRSDLETFKKHKWFRRCIITAHIGDHYFYKERNDTRNQKRMIDRDIDRNL